VLLPASRLLRDTLAPHTTKAVLVARDDAGRLRCTACAHRCVFDGPRHGACGVRFVTGDELRAPYGYVARRYVRSVETNTIYHVKPGALALTFGMYGCDLRCPYCQNARVSQALRENVSGEVPVPITAEALADEAVAAGCGVICAAYNEPMIAAEWVHAVFAAARARGLVTAIVSDGHSTPEALAYVREVTDVFRVDLKGFSPEHYKALGGRLEPVLESIREAKRLGLWVEVVTLVVPDFNDDPRGLRGLARELAAIDSEIPWHLNAFYPRYRMKDRRRTPVETLVSAAGTAYARGLRYVYVGNLAREQPHLASTRCPSCAEILVERFDYATRGPPKIEGGRCAKCAAEIPGIW